MIEIINFDSRPSLVSVYMAELRDVNVQIDPLRFRTNLRRIGQIMAYEISKRIKYTEKKVTTPLGESICHIPENQPVLATIMRAGIPFHEGFLSYFDYAENAFVSAYRRYKEKGDSFDVLIEYLASPDIEGKTLIIADPMLATGASMELAYKALLSKGNPGYIHIASVIASQQAVDYISDVFPSDRTSVWLGAVDPRINDHSYIVPGLGDAGDLAYGTKS